MLLGGLGTKDMERATGKKGGAAQIVGCLDKDDASAVLGSLNGCKDATRAGADDQDVALLVPCALHPVRMCDTRDAHGGDSCDGCALDHVPALDVFHREPLSSMLARLYPSCASDGWMFSRRPAPLHRKTWMNWHFINRAVV